VEIGFYWEEVNEQKFEALKKIENAPDYESLMSVFTEILTNLEQFFTSHIKIKGNTVITDVIKYIHQNYDRDISLKATAKHFFIDKSYLCKLFKKQLNQNFNDYLMQIRINKAKELLTNPEYTVNAVSLKVGYSDYSYFGRVFKKMVGQTPSEYKKSLFPTA
jgi:two-component system response regulator YesN